MPPFYAFITLDTPDSTNRVHASLILPGTSSRSRQSKTHPVLCVCDFLPLSDTNVKEHHMADG